MSSIQYQLNERYRIEVKQKTQEYYAATEHIRKQRFKLRNNPDKFHKIDAELEKLQKMIWDSIFDCCADDLEELLKELIDKGG